MNDPNLRPQWVPENLAPPPPRTLFSRVIEILVWVALIGIVAAVVIPEYAGRPVGSKELPSALVGFTLFPFIIAKLRRYSNPWAFALGGALILVGILVGGGMLRRSTPAHTAFNELVEALEKFDPETAKRVKSPSVKDTGQFLTVMQPALMRAARLAPDADLVTYSETLQQLVVTPQGVNRVRCELIATGKSGPTTLDDQIFMARATARLVRASVGRRDPPPIDRARAAEIFEKVYAEADPLGVTREAASLGAMTPGQACDLYLRILKVTGTLPVPDKALMLRSRMIPPEPT